MSPPADAQTKLDEALSRNDWSLGVAMLSFLLIAVLSGLEILWPGFSFFTALAIIAYHGVVVMKIGKSSTAATKRMFGYVWAATSIVTCAIAFFGGSMTAAAAIQLSTALGSLVQAYVDLENDRNRLKAETDELASRAARTSAAEKDAAASDQVANAILEDARDGLSLIGAGWLAKRTAQVSPDGKLRPSQQKALGVNLANGLQDPNNSRLKLH